MNQSKDKPSISEMLGELAAMESDGSPAFPMLRVECKHRAHRHVGTAPCRIENCAAHRKNCPGWRATTLDEARLCLEELLVAEGLTVEPGYGDGVDWVAYKHKAGQWGKGIIPTEAAIAALYAARKVKA